MTKDKRGIVAILVVIVMLLVVVSSLGSPLPTPLDPHVTLDEPCLADFTGDFGVVADAASRRLVFLDCDYKATGIVDLSSTSTPIDSANSVCVSNGAIYVAGTKQAGDTSSIASDRIIKFSPAGMYQGEVLAIERDAKSRDAMPNVVGLTTTDGGVMVALTMLTPKGERLPTGTVALFQVDDKGAREIGRSVLSDVNIINAGFAPNGNVLGGVDDYGSLSVVRDGGKADRVALGEVVLNLDAMADGRVLACLDNEHGLAFVGGAESRLLEGSSLCSVSSNEEAIIACSKAGNSVVFADGNGRGVRKLDVLDLAPLLLLRVVGAYCSGATLAIMALVFAIRRVKGIITAGQASSLGPLLGIVAIAAALVGCFVLFTYNSSKHDVDVRVNEVNMLADTLESSCPQEILQGMPHLSNNRNALREGNENAVKAATSAMSYLNVLCQTAASNDIGIYYCAYGRDAGGLFNIMDYGANNVFGSSVEKGNKYEEIMRVFDGAAANERMHVGSTRTFTTLHRLVPIADAQSGQVVAVVELGSTLESLESRTRTRQAEIVVSMLVVLMVVFLCYSEARGCGGDILRSRQAVKTSEEDALAYLARPVAFASTLVTSADAVMIVLIARDMLAGGQPNPLILAVPVACMRVGMFVGAALLPVLARRVSPRMLVLGGLAASAVFALCTAGTVIMGSFVFFCIARALLSAPLAMLFALGAMLPTVSGDADVRKRAADGVAHITVSAAALGMVAGGYVGYSMGNGWVYALAALLAALAFAVLLGSVAAFRRPLVNAVGVGQHALAGARATLRFVGSLPIVLLLLMVVLPMVCASGYQTLVFPLYASGLGISKASITNLFASAQMVVYLLAGYLIGLRARVGQHRVAAAAVGAIGVVFLVASYNQTLVWIVTGVVVIAVLVKATDAWKAIWAAESTERGLAPSKAYGSMVAAQYAVMLAQPLVMGLFGVAGNRYAGIALGVFSLVCAAAYGLASRRAGYR